ncbi:hypothetical protein WA158_006406 [Blastocystis sp. Blastoise]
MPRGRPVQSSNEINEQGINGLVQSIPTSIPTFSELHRRSITDLNSTYVEDTLEEIQDIFVADYENDPDHDEEEEITLIPFTLLSKLNTSVNLFNLTGFNEDKIMIILQQALQHYGMCSSTMLPANQAIFFTLMWYRLAISGNKLATQFHIKLSKIHTALRRGIHSIGMCFNEFSSNFDVPKLNMKLDRIDSRILSSLPKVLNSTFVIDGRHQLFGNISNNGIDVKKYYSYKHKKTALNSQFIINHNGYCVYASPGHPASSHDVIMYRTYRNVIINGLRNMIHDKYGEDNNSSNEELYILADEGYVGGGDELLTSPGSNHLQFLLLELIIILKIFLLIKYL